MRYWLEWRGPRQQHHSDEGLQRACDFWRRSSEGLWLLALWGLTDRVLNLQKAKMNCLHKLENTMRWPCLRFRSSKRTASFEYKWVKNSYCARFSWLLILSGSIVRDSLHVVSICCRSICSAVLISWNKALPRGHRPALRERESYELSLSLLLTLLSCVETCNS